MSSTVDVGDVNFGSIESAGSGFRELQVSPDRYGEALGSALASSERRAHILVRIILSTAASKEQRRADVTGLVGWAR